MICIPIKKKSVAALIKSLKQTQKSADIVEIWFDELGNKLTDQNLEKIFKLRKKPVIYKSFGKLNTFNKVLKYRPQYIDLDISTKNSLIKTIRVSHPKIKIIISFHDFKKTPSDNELKNIADKIISKGADIVKIATYAKKFSDSLRMLSFLSNLSKKHSIICLCMGPEGKLTRTTGHLLGNYLTYAALDKKSKTAPGQITIKEFIALTS